MDTSKIGRKRWVAGKAPISGLGAILVIVIIGVLAYYNNVFCSSGYCPTNYSLATKAQAQNSGGPYNAQFSAFNALTGAAMTSLSPEKVFNNLASPNSLDTSSSTSNPVQLASQIYASSNTYYVQAGKSTFSTTLTPFTPSFGPLQGGTSYQTLGNVYTVTQPTYVLKGAWANGTTFTTSQSYNVTSGTQSATQTITFTLSNSAVNTGWISAWDPANQQTQNVICVVNDTTTAQSLTFANYVGQPIQKGSALYYPYLIPDGFGGGWNGPTSPDGQPTSLLTAAVGSSSQIYAGGITAYQPISTGPITGGAGVNFQITIGVGSLSHGSSEAVGVECYQAADISVFNGAVYHYGNFGPDAVAKAQFTITIKK